MGIKDHTFHNYYLNGMSTINKSIEIQKRLEVARSWRGGGMQSDC